MKSFKEYVQGSNILESLLSEFIKISFDKFPQETLEFISEISTKDQELVDIYNKLKEKNSEFTEPELISPNASDNNYVDEG